VWKEESHITSFLLKSRFKKITPWRRHLSRVPQYCFFAHCLSVIFFCVALLLDLKITSTHKQLDFAKVHQMFMFRWCGKVGQKVFPKGQNVYPKIKYYHPITACCTLRQETDILKSWYCHKTGYSVRSVHTHILVEISLLLIECRHWKLNTVGAGAPILHHQNTSPAHHLT
jgi:hypothetical protein